MIERYEVEFAALDEGRRTTLEALGPALVSDALRGRQTMSGAIRPLAGGTRLIGQARTAVAYCDNSAACVAIPLVRPGEVLVIDADGGTEFAVWGDITTMEAVRRRIGGVVVDGVVRDSAAIRAMNLAMFCRGTTPRGPGPFRRGVIDAPIRAGGVTVRPGDVILGDDDGVVVVPLDQADAVIAAAQAKQAREREWIAAVEGGGSLADALGLPKATLVRR